MRIITVALLTTLATLAPANAQDVCFRDAPQLMPWARYRRSVRKPVRLVGGLEDEIGIDHCCIAASRSHNGQVASHDIDWMIVVLTVRQVPRHIAVSGPIVVLAILFMLAYGHEATTDHANDSTLARDTFASLKHRSSYESPTNDQV
jgi:hypothetical protein